MDDRELSKLSYLVAALVRSPRSYEEILGLVSHAWLIPPTPAFQVAIDALYGVFGAPKLNIKESAERLCSSRDANERAVGHSLQWNLHNARSRSI